MEEGPRVLFQYGGPREWNVVIYLLVLFEYQQAVFHSFTEVVRGIGGFESKVGLVAFRAQWIGWGVGVAYLQEPHLLAS